MNLEHFLNHWYKQAQLVPPRGMKSSEFRALVRHLIMAQIEYYDVHYTKHVVDTLEDEFQKIWQQITGVA